MRIRILLQNSLLLILLISFLGFTPEVLKAIQGQTETAQVHKVSLTDLQQNFYKADIENEISVMFQETMLEEALSEVTRKAGLKLTYRGDHMVEKSVSLQNESITVSDALDYILDGTGLDYRLSNTGYLLISESQENIEETIYQETVTGQVVDATTMNPLPGATVIIEGTNIGTTTDLDGRFEIEVESLNQTLIFSYVGYERQEVQIDGRTEIDIQLQSMALEGEDIVVTALGIDRQARGLGYSITRASPEDVTVNRSPNFVDALQGRMAGVNISSVGTGPQGSSKIRIRGQSSFGANNSPLIVVNGVPIDNTSFGVAGDVGERGTSRNSDSGDGLSSINPDDIEDITVLKGGAAAALYGSRAKDGVIMITTRQRAEGIGTQVEYNSNFQFSRPIDRRDYQFEYGQGEGGQRPTSANPGSGVWSFGERFEPNMTHTLFDGIEVPYEPQPDQLREYYRNGTNLSNTITLSHGGETGGFNISLSNQQSEAILPGSSFERNNISVGFTQMVADRLTLSGNVSYANEDRTNPPNIHEQDYSPVVIYTLASSMPMDVLEANAFTEEGDEPFWSRFTNRTNPYFALSRFENNERDRIYGNITANLDFTDWLSVQGRIGQDYFYREQDYNLPTGSQRQAPAPPGFVNGQYIQDQLRSREINADFLVMANQNFGPFGVDANFGGNLMYRRTDRHNVLAQDFYTRGLYAIGNGRVVDPNYNLSERQVNSLYGSAQVDYNAMFFVSGTLRNDWFSTLSPENRSILYPSVTASAVFSEIFEANIPGWLTFGRVFASYSEVGSDTDVQPYAGNLNYTINPTTFRDGPLGGISGNQVPNPDLRPMRVREWEFGLELSLFDNLSLELSYYDKLSKDQILQQQISNVSGFTNQLINVGESLNQGVEMMVDFFPIRSETYSWNFNFNASYNTTEVLDLGSDVDVDEITMGTHEFHGELRQVTGLPMNQLYGFGFAEDDQGRTIFNPDNGLPFRSENQRRFGSALPKWTGGFYNRFHYRDLSMSFLIDFTLGHKLISGTHINAYRHGNDKATLVGRDQGFVVGDGVNPDGSENTAQAEIQDFYQVIRTHRTAEQSVFDASNWQLRQITVGYDLTRQVAEPLGLRGLRLSIVANNIAVLRSHVPHIHPDQNGLMSDTAMGLESTGLPVTTNIGFNLNVQI